MSNIATDFGMELSGIKVVFLQHSTEWPNVIASGRGIFADVGAVAMHEVNKGAFRQTFGQWSLQISNIIPANMWYFKTRHHRKPPNIESSD